MLMLLREDRIILYGDNMDGSKKQEDDPGYLGNDTFFKKNYQKIKSVNLSKRGWND